MILDAQLLFSGAPTGPQGALVGQAITATAVSANTIDIGNMATLVGGRNIGAGEDIRLFVKAGVAFNTLTSLTVEFISATDPLLTAGIIVHQTFSRTLAQLTADSVQIIGTLPIAPLQRYIGLRYTVVGAAPTTGTVVAGLLLSVQTSIV